MNAVKHLKKISLSLRAGTTPETEDLPLKNSRFEFIFGVGPSGMSPFEYEMVNKRVGETVVLQLKSETMHDKFEHLHMHFQEMLDNWDTFYLRVTIDGVSSAGDKEIVRAMADAANQAGGCGCGCGCS